MAAKSDLNSDETSPLPQKKLRNSSTNQLYALSYRVMDMMDESLIELNRDIAAKCSMVIDRTGCVMASAGDFSKHEPSTLGATAAAVIAALNTFANGKSVNHASVHYTHQSKEKILFQGLEQRLVLCVLHDHKDTAELEEKCHLFVNAISKEIEEDKEKILTGKSELQESVSYIESKLDQLFKDHLS